MPTAAIKIEGIRKRYMLGQFERYLALRDVIAQAVGAPFRAMRRRGSRTRHRRPTFWALDGVSFDVAQGEVVGVIGRNGAGKTTLLKILSRITEPTEGRALLRGRVGSLLEVGTGFHPELTGRENIFLSGAILGMRRREISQKFDEIVDFAGVERFMDTPVKRYSSGMYVRLAFAVAAHLEPEILLVDEVLSVGDAEFQRKCLGKMEDVTHQGRTVIFVSHNMAAVRKLCPRAILLEKGSVVIDGPTDRVIARYFDSLGGHSGTSAVVEGDELNELGRHYLFQDEEFFRLDRIALVDEAGQPRTSYRSGEPVSIAIEYDVMQPFTNLQLIVELTDEDGRVLLRTESGDEPQLNRYYVSEPGRYAASCTIPADVFGEQRFYVTVHAIAQGMQHVACEQILHFDATFEGYNDNLSAHSRTGYFRPRIPWTTEVQAMREV